jgi:hypothetical protein
VDAREGGSCKGCAHENLGEQGHTGRADVRSEVDVAPHAPRDWMPPGWSSVPAVAGRGPCRGPRVRRRWRCREREP